MLVAVRALTRSFVLAGSPGSGNNYWGDSEGFRGDAALRLYMARKMPPMIAASAEAPVAKAMTR